MLFTSIYCCKNELELNPTLKIFLVTYKKGTHVTVHNARTGVCKYVRNISLSMMHLTIISVAMCWMIRSTPWSHFKIMKLCDQSIRISAQTSFWTSNTTSMYGPMNRLASHTCWVYLLLQVICPSNLSLFISMKALKMTSTVFTNLVVMVIPCWIDS